MEQRISIEQLCAIAEHERKKIRSKGGFPKRRRMAPRSKEKEEALFLLRLNASIKYGLKRFPDGTFRMQKTGSLAARLQENNTTDQV